MYPLDKGIIYIYKPPIYLRYDECNKVEFERTGGQVWTLTFFSFYLLFHFRKIKDEPRHLAWGKFHNKLLTGYSDLPPSWGLKSLKTERSQYQSSVTSNGHCSFRGLFPWSLLFGTKESKMIVT